MRLLLYLLNNLQAKRSKHRKDIFHGLHVDSISESLTAHTPHVRLKSFKFQDFVVIALKKKKKEKKVMCSNAIEFIKCPSKNSHFLKCPITHFYQVSIQV